IWLTDPFIRYPYQIDNLVDFIQMVNEVSTHHDGIKIHLSTQNDDNEKIPEMIDNFDDLASDLASYGIEFTYDFNADHDRIIKTDTGWIMTLGRGLDIYEKYGRFSLGRGKQENRRCKAFNISINKIEK
ncbi:MIT domain-containing protein 1, partial [gut metagenome]